MNFKKIITVYKKEITVAFRDRRNLYNFNFEHIFLVFTSNIVFAIISVSLASIIFTKEETLLNTGKDLILSFHRSKIQASLVPKPAAALFVFAIVMILNFYIGPLLHRFSIYGGLTVL